MTSKRTTLLPLQWGLLHGINDLVAGYMLARFAIHHDRTTSSLMLIIYAIIGFGGQLPVGMWLDASRSVRLFTRAALLLLICSSLAWWVNPVAGIIVAGLSSAFVHVTGGAVCLEAADDRIGPLGIFTAPGVLGLTLGGLAFNLPDAWLLVSVLATMAVGLRLLRPAAETTPTVLSLTDRKSKPTLDSHDMIMLGILLTVTFRSLVYDIMQQVAFNWQQGALVIGISAFTGKIIGGFVADRIGWKAWVYITLPLAFVLLQFGSHDIYMLGFGIACLQSSVPISLLLMRRSLPAYPGTSSAMVLGVGIALAGLPMYVMDHRIIINGWFGMAGTIISLLLMLLVMGYLLRKGRTANV